MIFTWLGWNGTWLPLIVPHFFANAFNVFLLRQYFMTIPREIDEAAMIDGAGPFRILRSVIVPQSIPAITAVTLFHFFFAWNDFFVPLLYLANKPELQPLSIGDPAVQRAVREPADADPGVRACSRWSSRSSSSSSPSARSCAASWYRGGQVGRRERATRIRVPGYGR